MTYHPWASIRFLKWRHGDQFIYTVYVIYMYAYNIYIIVYIYIIICHVYYISVYIYIYIYIYKYIYIYIYRIVPNRRAVRECEGLGARPRLLISQTWDECGHSLDQLLN